MSTVKEIETAIRKLSLNEVRSLQGLIEEMMEDEMEFTDEFKSSIERGWQDIDCGRLREDPPSA